MTQRLENLSAYIICKDEQDWIEPCIRSLACCAEIVVVDSGSTDNTLKILSALTEEGFPIRVLHQAWPGYSAQKQFALEQCTLEWCLCIDADERLSDELSTALPSYLARKDVDGWKIERRPYIYGYGYAPASTRGPKLLRLTRNGKANYDLRRLVHESMAVDGKVSRLAGGTLLHRREPPLEQQMLKEVSYAGLKAEQLMKSGKKPRYFRLVLNPFAHFIKSYLINRLFLAGWPGLIHSQKMAAYAFMTEAILIQKYNANKNEHLPEPDAAFAKRKPWAARDA